MSRTHVRAALLAAASVTSAFATSHARAETTLEGWALLPAKTTSAGPTSGQLAITESSKAYLPLANAQPVQGFSAVLHGSWPGTYHVMPDNGFGSQTNSADALLRVYAVKPAWKRWNGSHVVGKGTVSPVGFFFGLLPLEDFNKASFISLRDPNRKLTFKIQAELDNYYGDATKPAVDPSIKANRLLTGADFDIESVRRDWRGNLWFGDEFGPFLVKTDATGKVLRAEIPLPNARPAGSTATGAHVQAPANPFLNGATPNLNSSSGFEGMAINASHTKLYPLLEGTVAGDPARSLRISEFDLSKETYTGRTLLYRLDEKSTAIGDFTAVNDHEFLIIERNNDTGTRGTPYKHIFLIDIDRVDADGYVAKSDLVDLMNVSDPHDLNGDGNTLFTFPYVTVESVLILSPRVLLVINDNNFPAGGGRSAAPDNTEFLRIRLDHPLEVSRHTGAEELEDDAE